jgi:hypothetical protein
VTLFVCFKKDGDYNKNIPEMQKEVPNKKYCTTNMAQTASSTSTNLLCNRCNQNQELKLQELKKFEEKLDLDVN